MVEESKTQQQKQQKIKIQVDLTVLTVKPAFYMLGALNCYVAFII